MFEDGENNEKLKFNFSAPEPIPPRWILIGKGLIEVTKVRYKYSGAKPEKNFFDGEDQLEQWYIYLDNGPPGFEGLPVYHIYRCPPGEECKDKKPGYTSTNAISKGLHVDDSSDDKFRFYTYRNPKIGYNLTLVPNQEEQSLNDFFKGIEPDAPLPLP